jgi:hypothetical protein
MELTLQPQEKLFWEKQFDMVVPMSLRDTTAELTRLEFDHDTRFSMGGYYVYLTPETAGSMTFTIKKTASKQAPAWAMGCLEKLDDHSTRITGKVGTENFDGAASLLILVGPLGLFLANLLTQQSSPTMNFLPILIIVTLASALTHMAWNRSRLTTVFADLEARSLKH